MMLRRAADEFVMAIEMFYEVGGAKPRNGGWLKNKGIDWEPVVSFHFHAASIAEPVGHSLSKPKIKVRSEIRGVAA